MPQVKFTVAGSDLTSFYDRMKQKGNELSNGAIENAKREKESAKEQLKLVEQQIALIERKNRLESSNNQLQAKSGFAGRLENIDRRNQTLENLHTENLSRLMGGKINQQEYEFREGGINQLRERNTEGSISKEYREFEKKRKEEENERKIQTRLARENVEAVKQGAKENVKAVQNGDTTIADVITKAQTSDEELAARLAKEDLEQKEKKEKKDEKSGGGIFGGLLGADSFIRVINSASQFASTQNGFDLIKPASDTAGRIIGAALGGVVGLLGGPGGAMVGAGVGSQIGGAVASAGGEFVQRRGLSMQDYLSAQNRYSATTGASKDGMSLPDMSESGLAIKDFLVLMRETSRGAGSSLRGEKYSSDAYYADKGYGVDQGTSLGIIELQRSGRENNKDLANLIGGVLQKGSGTFFKGGDTTFLNEFLTKFTTLQKDLLRTQNEVHSGTTYDILSKFDSVGGQFAAKDPRSLGLVEGINNALVNPGSDNMKAASFMALRRSNPNMGYIDLLKEQQKGLASPTYMRSMMEMLDSMPGDRDMKIRNIMGAFNLGGNAAAAESLYDNRNKLKNITSQQDLERLLPTSLKEKAIDNTTPIEKNTADISNKLLGGWYDTLDAMQDSFSNALQQVVDGVNAVNENGRIKLVKTASGGGNTTKTAKQASSGAPLAPGGYSQTQIDAMTPAQRHDALMNVGW